MSTEIRSALRAWVVRKNGKISAEQLRDDTPIIEERVVTSLQIMDLILFIEELRGAPVDVESLRGGAFSSINAIYAAFFAKEAA